MPHSKHTAKEFPLHLTWLGVKHYLSQCKKKTPKGNCHSSEHPQSEMTFPKGKTWETPSHYMGFGCLPIPLAGIPEVYSTTPFIRFPFLLKQSLCSFSSLGSQGWHSGQQALCCNPLTPVPPQRSNGEPLAQQGLARGDICSLHEQRSAINAFLFLLATGSACCLCCTL